MLYIRSWFVFYAEYLCSIFWLRLQASSAHVLPVLGVAMTCFTYNHTLFMEGRNIDN
jgi:hypothetical protein